MTTNCDCIVAAVSAPKIVSLCRPQVCVASQLGSRYITWAQDERVFAYLPRIRQRVLVGRAPAGVGAPPRVVGTHLYAPLREWHDLTQWVPHVYMARFRAADRGTAVPDRRRAPANAAPGKSPRVVPSGQYWGGDVAGECRDRAVGLRGLRRTRSRRLG